MSPLTKFIAAAAVAASTVAAYSGDMTYFYPRGVKGLGACGGTNNQGDAVVALSPSEYSGGSHCGQWITIQGNGHTTAAQVVDECPGCASGSIDVSPAIFDDIADLSVGRIGVTWWFQ
ncbi:hypothetical protein SLS62_008398 [Diatrype stigma]|uniref:RlpA-like protein double-psi beta-barrel domain-containing protein n=1 Tax=Diatrype stigma TaxID=117547 RepID=A0AAN9UJP6_9PEZI